MKRKLIAAALCAAMVLGVTSCGSKEPSLSPKEEYAAATQKIEKAEGMDSKLEMKMKIGVQGMNMDMSMAGDVKMVKKSADDMQMLMELDTKLLGQSVPIAYYYKDNKFYMNAADQKIACKMDMEKAQEKISDNYGMTNVDVKMIKDVKVEDEDGNRVLTYTLDSNKMNEYVKKSLKSIGDLAQGADETNVSIKEFKGRMVVDKDGNPLKQVIRFNMSMKVGDQDMTAKVEATMKYNKLGKDVTIKFPFFDNYKEVDESELNKVQ